MPYHIIRKESKYVVVNTDTKEEKGTHDTRKEALDQLSALYANEEDAGKSLDAAKIGARNNAGDRQAIRSIRKLAGQIHEHTMALEPTEEDSQPYQEKPSIDLSAAGLMMEAAMGKSLNLSYAKSLGLSVADDKLSELVCVKSTGIDTIRGYAMLWGGPGMTDVEMEYFKANTDFWDAALGYGPRPLTWDHDQDETFKADPVIGQIVEFGDDEIGRWYEAKLDRAHKYHFAIEKLVKAGKIGTSSDSAPQYVVREKTGKSTWLKRWPFFAAALTDVPAEPRMIGSLEIIKSLGIQLPEPETTKQSWEWLKARKDALMLDR